jgi:hypothetical protein
MTWVLGKDLDATLNGMVFSGEGISFSDEIMGLCMECLLRDKGKHYHGVMGWALKKEAHQGWFRADTIEMMRQGLLPQVDMAGIIDYVEQWSLEVRDGVEFLKLTIAADEEQEETERTYVWKLRYDQPPRLFHGISTIHGVWPD